MRILAVILSTIVLILALKPGMDLIAMQIAFEQSCCGAQCSQVADFENFEDQKPDDGCDGNGCNPFQVCCSNVLFFPSTPLQLAIKPQIASKINYTFQSAYSLLIAFDFWQPPKIV